MLLSYRVIVIGWAVINVLTFAMYGIDKWKARRARWRIPESTLIGMAVLGGSLGAFLGMRIWHHKTQHAKFRYGIPIILFLHLSLALILATCD